MAGISIHRARALLRAVSLARLDYDRTAEVSVDVER